MDECQYPVTGAFLANSGHFIGRHLRDRSQPPVGAIPGNRTAGRPLPVAGHAPTATLGSITSQPMAQPSGNASVVVYSKPDCHLCVDAMVALRRLQGELGFALAEHDITADEALHRAYFERIPVVTLDGHELCEYFVDEALVRERLESRT
jgi:glutaredoxin